MSDKGEKTCETRGRPFMRGMNVQKRAVVFFRPRCKSWTCPACAEINARLWAHRTYYGCEQLSQAGGALNFVTLTAHEKLNQVGALKVWPKAWKKLHTRANRAGGKCPYLLVPEQHKSGKMHVHLLTTWAMSARWWRDNARQCGLGYQVTVETVSDAAIGAYYVTKYLVKQMALNAWPKGFRHVRTSRDWPKESPKAIEDGWKFDLLEREDKLTAEIERYAAWGWSVQVGDHLSAWDVVSE